MKHLFTSAFLLFSFAAFAQTATKTGSSTSGTTATAQTTTLSAKAKSLCKEWKLSKTENFGDQHDPTDQQKNDQLILMDNGRYRFVYNGEAEGGTWTLDKTNVWLTLTTDAGVVKKLKIMESTDTTLKIDYRDSDDVHNILYYSTSAGTANTH